MRYEKMFTILTVVVKPVLADVFDPNVVYISDKLYQCKKHYLKNHLVMAQGFKN